MADNDNASAQERQDFYIAKAKEAEDRAATIKDTMARRMILQMAESWRILAQSIRRYPQ